MATLNTTCFSPAVANVLMLAGGVPAQLAWHLRPNKSGKEILDLNQSDAELLKCKSVADEGHSAAVRSLLYLWIGWPAEAGMYAQGAHDPERLYIEAIRSRQVGDVTPSKEFLRELGDHALFAPLASYAIESIRSDLDRVLERFKRIVKMGETWEPHAFADTFEQARLGQLGHPAVLVVRALQHREFELLFVRCYEGAIGRSIEAFEQPSSPKQQRKKRAPVKRPAQRPPTPTPTPDEPKEASPRPFAKRLGPLGERGPRVGAYCPHCHKVALLPEARRGTQHHCEQCKTLFLIPRKVEPNAAS